MEVSPVFPDGQDPDGVFDELGTILMAIAPRIAHLQREALSKMDPPLGITQYGVLVRLERGVTSMSELRGRSLVTFSTLSEATSALVRQGLVDRVRSEQDRRSVDLSLTPQGVRVLEHAQKALREIRHELTRGLTLPPQEQLHEFWHPLSQRVREMLAEHARHKERGGAAADK